MEKMNKYYPEKFEFAIDYKFSGEEEENKSIDEEDNKSIDDFIEVDIYLMVKKFVKTAVDRLPWSKDVPEEIPEGLVFLR